MADDLGREPIPGVAGANGCPHPTRLLIPIGSRKRGKARQVDGAREVKDWGIHFTVTKAIGIGRRVRQAQRHHEEPVDAVLDEGRGKLIISALMSG
jgi:DUF917 family protein